MQCHSCGVELPLVAKYCPLCGVTISYILPKALAPTPFKHRVTRIVMICGTIVLALLLIIGTFVSLTPRGKNITMNPYPPYNGRLIFNNPMNMNNNGYYYWDQTTLGDG